LALVIGTSAGGGSAMELSAKLLAECGRLERLATHPPSGLGAIKGIGPAKLASLLAAVEMGRRMAARPLRAGDSIKSPRDVYRHFYQRLRDRKQEYFMTLLLDGRHRVLRESQISQGTLTASLVHPREVFRHAIGAAAAALVLVHNHPSGNPEPSAEDLRVTRRLVEAGEVLGIRVVDHVIVAEEGFYSFQEHEKISE
jgi:DNA repair protein RadC